MHHCALLVNVPINGLCEFNRSVRLLNYQWHCPTELLTDCYLVGEASRSIIYCWILFVQKVFDPPQLRTDSLSRRTSTSLRFKTPQESWGDGGLVGNHLSAKKQETLWLPQAHQGPYYLSIQDKINRSRTLWPARDLSIDWRIVSERLSRALKRRVEDQEYIMSYFG